MCLLIYALLKDIGRRVVCEGLETVLVWMRYCPGIEEHDRE
jgi:hypothetical protein